MDRGGNEAHAWYLVGIQLICSKPSSQMPKPRSKQRPISHRRKTFNPRTHCENAALFPTPLNAAQTPTSTLNPPPPNTYTLTPLPALSTTLTKSPNTSPHPSSSSPPFPTLSLPTKTTLVGLLVLPAAPSSARLGTKM